MSRIAVIAACALLGFGGDAVALSPNASIAALAPPAASAASVVSYTAPIAGAVVVVRAFQAPPGPYAAGHRGVDLASTPNQAIFAAAAGRVRFAGPVAGRGVVVIEHSDGVLTEYEPVTVAVRAGEQVSRAQRIGRVDGTHGGCRPGRCLHWGARRDGVYFDPMTLLAGLGPVRLLPWP